MKINSLIALIIASLISITDMSAQRRGSTELAFGWGRLSTNEIGNGISELGLQLFTLGDVQRTDFQHIGASRVSLKVAPYDRLTIGASVTYEQINSNIMLLDAVVGNQKLYFLTGAFELDYRYITTESFQMYFSLAGGGTVLYDVFDTDDTSPETFDSYNEIYDPYPNFHANLLGFRFGTNLGIFAEFGFGYKGIVNVGLSFQPKPLDKSK